MNGTEWNGTECEDPDLPPGTNAEDRFWMQQALLEARRGGELGEVPVGAVLIHDQKCLAVAHNAPIHLRDPTAHAEILALRLAGQHLGNYRLPGSTLYVTLEPCSMCVGAMIHARIARLVYGAADPRTGAVGGALDLLQYPAHNHRILVVGGLCADQSAALLREFFRARRRRSGSGNAA
jgi:tRNA(adenine34) deaminase